MFSAHPLPLLLIAAIAISQYSTLTSAADSHTAESGSRGVHRTVLQAVTEEDGKAIELYGESHALLIGASRYHDWSHLPSISDELDDVEDALSATGFNVERLTDPDSKALKNGITEFINNYGYEPENRLLIYFSGHGHSVGDKGFLLPVDIPLPEKKREFRRRALPMTQVLAWAKDMEAKHVLFVFDSCFAGSVFKSKSMPEDSERYIRKATALPVRQFITAGSANEEVPAKSTFTPAFVSAIKGEGDLNNDGYITGSELGVHLSQLVPQFVDQTPQYGKIRDYNLSRGDFVFFSDNSKQDPEPDTSVIPALYTTLSEIPSQTMEVLLWQSAEKGDSVRDYQVYLERYPTGEFAALAEGRIDKLEKAMLNSSADDEQPENRFYFEPETVKIAGGTFMMGSRDGPESAKPVQLVKVAPFEIGKYEVTFDEFDQFTLANAIENVDDNGWGRGQRPVINVSWELAKQYTKWLSSVTGRRYRLPIESEWEYAARAGHLGDYSFGDDPSLLCEYSNMSYKTKVCKDTHKFTSPVGSYKSNAWGAHDLHGNVWEWTEDCWHPNYHGLPNNGRAWIRGGDCDQRVTRGGAWYSEAKQLRSSHRNRSRINSGSDSIGFRVVRMLDPTEPNPSQQ